MNKSTVTRILFKLLLIFLVVTIYFYFQKPIEYRCTNLKAVIPIDDMTLVIDDIRISDRDQEKLNSLASSGIPWIYEKILEAGLPWNWTVKLFNVVAFYTYTPRTMEKADINISGALLYPAEARNSIKSSDAWNNFKMSISPGNLSSNGARFNSSNNYCSVFCGGTFNLKDLNKKLTLSITDKINNKTIYIYISPQWKKTRPLNQGASGLEKDLNSPVRSFVNHLANNNIQAAMENIMPVLRNDFEIPQLDINFRNDEIRYTSEYIAYLMGYSGAYKITAEAGRFLNEEQTDFEATSDERLIFYVAGNDRDGKFYITRVHQPYVSGSDTDPDVP
ncbi:MAG: hypothetical protein GXY50_07335 [Syntrophomonadaceae bacterium]|mgnify:CR=1 FL=1|nr:hypothetical protein [Syntrophomonadaceae bacterium]